MMRPFIKQILCIHKLNNRLAKQPEWEPEFSGVEYLNKIFMVLEDTNVATFLVSKTTLCVSLCCWLLIIMEQIVSTFPLPKIMFPVMSNLCI